MSCSHAVRQSITQIECVKNETINEDIMPIEDRVSIEFDALYFNFDSSLLTSDSIKILEAIKLELNKEANYIVIGYTDSQGTIEYNYQLGLQRARAIQEYLKGYSIQIESNGKSQASPAPDKLDRKAVITRI
jgi:outer membrane protein OmpA-like peptidoglycan-associated protein